VEGGRLIRAPLPTRRKSPVPKSSS
jgi:hypothetical protein